MTSLRAAANLHAVWDSGILTPGSVTLEQAQKWLATQDEKASAQADLAQRALGAHMLAIYNTYLISADLQVSYDCVNVNVPVVVAQRGSAGVRLAAILNAALGQKQLR